MADEGMDPCECIWSHELAMRRLLSLLRQSQSFCTDTECIDVNLPQPSNSSPTDFFMLTILVMFAMLMYYMRPQNRRITGNPSKPSQNGNDADGSPPAPPTFS